RTAARHVVRQLALHDAGPGRLSRLLVHPPLLIARTAGHVDLTLVQRSAVRRVGKPDAAILMHRDVVRRVQPLALIRIGDGGNRSVVLVTDDAARAVLARELATLEIKRVAVAVVRWRAEHRDPSVIVQIAHLTVVRDVAPHQVPALARPRRPLAPQPAGPQTLNRRVA